MQLGFVSAILPELTLENVLGFARREGFSMVGVQCWQALPEDKGYTCGTHLDVTSFTKLKAESLLTRCKVQNISISALEAYPIMLGIDHIKSLIAIKRFRKTITAASRLGLKYVSVFVVRDQTQSIDANWSEFLRVCRPLVKYAKQRDIDVCLKTSPAFFNHEHHPVGENLLASPFLWCRVFSDIPAPNLGMELDPASLTVDGIDPLPLITEYRTKLFSVAIRVLITAIADPKELGGCDSSRFLNQPALLSRGGIAWTDLARELLRVGYKGPVCMEIESEGAPPSLDARMNALRAARMNLATCFSGCETRCQPQLSGICVV